ncbi:putative signal transducing protein [Alkaliphilus serpentinus]|uniref:DUF2007 domain-containing protein n=1 Tax=Alkaliphilus serpentinus TaxID=1482731 RepID=A0A833HMM0_9FIRM|nr:DUF2007 domain-containing protein [Alkaliphilus serpentinus]KAB3527688.1 DUF2007 domain-containing protein [Alkaliphilus serpentinus]
MNNGWKKVANVYNDVEAAIIQDILQLEGIESMVYYRSGTGYLKILTGNIIGTKGADICVAPEDEGRALEIIRIFKEEEITDDEE